MKNNQTESDWKRFSKNLELLRNEYLDKQNRILIGIFEDPNRDPTQRFWDAAKTQKRIQRELKICLDDCSRSSMSDKVFYMLKFGMMSQEFLSGFSEPFQALFRNR